VLSSVLETAVEYEHLRTNPAKGRRRRLPVSKKPRSFLDTAAHIAALLDGASGLDAAARRRRGQRRALATLAFAGLRIGEALDLRWVDVNLADAKIKVRDSKTAAGIRTIDLLPALRDELIAYKASVRPAPSSLVFGTTTGGRQSETNVRRRILAPAVTSANGRRSADDLEPLPEGLTPHSLRRTYAFDPRGAGSRCRA
jgi:integrase